MWWFGIGRHISVVEVSPEEQGVPDPHWAHHPWGASAGKRNLHNMYLAVEISRDSIQVRQRAAVHTGVPLKGLSTDPVAQEHWS